MGRRHREDRGAAAVEFALVAPLLLLLVFGIISYGYMLSFRQTISQAAAEGARAAAVTLSTPGGTEQADAARGALDQSLDGYGITCAGTALLRGGATVGWCTVTVAQCSNNTARDCVTVSLSYDYEDHPLLPTPGFGLAIPDSLGYTAVAEVS